MLMIQKDLEVAYSVAEMYALVNDIEAYAEFLPWCVESKIIDQDEDNIRGRLTLQAGGMFKSLTTLNRSKKDKMIEIRLIEGPLQRLEGFWLFEATPKGCRVRLNLGLEFTSRFFGLVLSPVLEKITRKLMKAFSDRAEQIYGKR